VNLKDERAKAIEREQVEKSRFNDEIRIIKEERNKLVDILAAKSFRGHQQPSRRVSEKENR
jgi:hypothetical protein